MLRRFCTQQFATAHDRSRTCVRPRCTATMQLETADTQPRAPSRSPSSRPDQPYIAGPRSRAGPRQSSRDAPSTGGTRRRQATGEVRRTQRASTAGREQWKRLPEFVFLDNDPESMLVPVKMLKTHLLKDPGQVAIIRSLGLMGYMGALSSLMATRASALAASPPLDVRVRLYPQESMSPFGTPFMMFVESVPEPLPLPSREEKAPSQDKTFSVTDPAELPNLRRQLPRAVTALQPGEYLVVEATGIRNQYNCLKAIAAARAVMGREGRFLFVIPEEVELAAAQPSGGGDDTNVTRNPATTEPAAPVSLASSADPFVPAAAAPQGARQATAVSAVASGAENSTQPTTPSRSVAVQRFYVGRSEPRTEAAAVPESVAATATAMTAAVAAATASVASAGEDQVLVSASELEMLRGALGSMMEQQKLLTKLLEQQKAAVAARAAGGSVEGASAVV